MAQIMPKPGEEVGAYCLLRTSFSQDTIRVFYVRVGKGWGENPAV